MLRKNGRAWNRVLNAWGKLELVQDQIAHNVALEELPIVQETLAEAQTTVSLYKRALDSFAKKLH